MSQLALTGFLSLHRRKMQFASWNWMKCLAFFPRPPLFASTFRSPLFGHDAIAKQRVGLLCFWTSPILSSHNNGAAFFPLGVKQLLPLEFSRLVPNVLIVSVLLEAHREQWKWCLPRVVVLSKWLFFESLVCDEVPPSLQTRRRPALGSLAGGKPLLVAQPCVTEELSAPLNPAICASSLHLSITAGLPNPSLPSSLLLSQALTFPLFHFNVSPFFVPCYIVLVLMGLCRPWMTHRCPQCLCPASPRGDLHSWCVPSAPWQGEIPGSRTGSVFT